MDNKLFTEQNSSNDDWGGKWTQDKIEIFKKYLSAYLTIMNKYPNYELWYFDGFAGSGHINIDDSDEQKFIEGIALTAIEIDKPKPFDAYYFVELDENKALKLKSLLTNRFPLKRTYVVEGNCNDKLVDFAKFLRNDTRKKRGLAILDPYGMALNWASLEAFKDLYCDIWILVPTGIGVNRLLKQNGEINESWMNKLTAFLGLTEVEIKKRFYRKTTNLTLFGEEEKTEKVEKAIENIVELYRNRLKDIWKFVSKPFIMKNSRGSIMFHFICVSQVAAGAKIADDIIDMQNK